jgi:type IV pilus assembly protein PilF
MTTSMLSWRFLAGLACAVALSCQLAGCAAGGAGAGGRGGDMVDDGQHGASTPTTTTTSVATGSRTDLVTASDETELQRRARIRLELASAYFAEDKTSTALDEVKQALQADPNRAAAYNLRGLIYARLDEPALAEDSFRRALQLAPGDGDTRHNYGWFLCSRQRYPDAFAQFRAALETPQYRSASKTWLAQGVCEARSGDWTSAERSLLRSYELDAGNPSTAVNLAEVLMRRGELERARFYIGRVNADTNYANAETLWLAARIEHRRGNLEGAQQFGEQLQKRYPGSAQALAFERRRFNE